jgi:hypothetical protein
VDQLVNTGDAGCPCPTNRANPSDIAANPDQWIQQNGDDYAPLAYEIKGQIDPSRPDSLANVSNRGLAGQGDQTLITGFIVTGGQPRTVVIRALGPTLASAGVTRAAANPALSLFHGSAKVAANSDWKTDVRSAELSQNYPSLAPGNDKEAALLITLMPGAYTAQGSTEDGVDGIELLEVYDVDSGTSP